jgi:hypothetical protein
VRALAVLLVVVGLLRPIVPGAVDAYLTLLETYGTKRIADILAPAVQYAEQGFPMYEYMHRMLSIPETRAQFDVYPPGGHEVFYPGGRNRSRGFLRLQILRSATCGPSSVAIRKSCPARMGHARPERRRMTNRSTSVRRGVARQPRVEIAVHLQRRARFRLVDHVRLHHHSLTSGSHPCSRAPKPVSRK